MLENENITTEEKADFEELSSNFDSESYHSNEFKGESRKVGKPVTNGRSKKISLYLTPETFNRLDDLRKYDEADLQDLLNEAFEVYFKAREDDIKFLQEQEEARRARKLERARKAE